MSTPPHIEPSGSRENQQHKPTHGDIIEPQSENIRSKASRSISPRPSPIRVGSTQSDSLRSAPLSKPFARDHSPPPPRTTHSASNSPTRLVPGQVEQRRSSDSGPIRSTQNCSTENDRGERSSIGTQGQPESASRGLARSSSLKRAAFGKNIEALLKGKRRHRKNSDPSSTSQSRSTSVPASPTQPRSPSPVDVDRRKDEVVFKRPTWSASQNGHNNSTTQLSKGANAPTSARANDGVTAPKTPEPTTNGPPQPRRISFGVLPRRVSAESDNLPREDQAQNKESTSQGEGRKISFGALPNRPNHDPSAIKDEGQKIAQEDDDEEDAEELESSDNEEDEKASGDMVSVGSGNSHSRSPNRNESNRRVKAIPRPTFTITGPDEEKTPPRKMPVHPNTNYSSRDFPEEDDSSSDSEEDMSDIRRAQRLSINLSKIDNSIKHRSIRTIIRGDFSGLQDEEGKGRKRLRTYLVASDLSGEAAYALEWTIGTVLRDGDTLFAVYAVDQEITSISAEAELPIGEGGNAIRETEATVGRLGEASKAGSRSQSSFLRKNSAAPIPKDASQAEQERQFAVEEISQTCIRFLRKTKLQVRIGVEIVHCASPRHMITEAIDELEPTMVIVGSRGQSALKGVLLGSFSNYLVMKSSAPVMVARKKLRTASKTTKIRLANNLSVNRKPLSEARVD